MSDAIISEIMEDACDLARKVGIEPDILLRAIAEAREGSPLDEAIGEEIRLHAIRSMDHT
jgi:hypothetical protein